MRKNVTKLISSRVLCTSITNRVFSWFDRFTAFYYFMSRMSRNSYLREFCAQVSQIVFQADLTVLSLIRNLSSKMSQNSYLREFCAQVAKIEFLAELTILRFVTTVWARNTQNSYLCEFCAQVSQIVFLGYLTVLRLFTIVWAKISQNSFLHEFCAQVSKIVSLADLIVLTAYYNCMSKNVTKLISPRVLCTSITNRVLSRFDRYWAC